MYAILGRQSIHIGKDTLSKTIHKEELFLYPKERGYGKCKSYTDMYQTIQRRYRRG